MPTIKELQELVAKEGEKGPVFPKLPTIPYSNIAPVPHVSVVTAKHHEANSAAALVSHLSATVNAWTRALPSNVQVVIYAMLLSGEQVRVSHISAEGQNGVAIHSPDGYLVVVHQANLQLLCFGESLEEPAKRRPIGFSPGTSQAQEDPQ